MKYLILILLLVSCANEQNEFQGVDPEFEPYLYELDLLSIQYTGRNIINVTPINFKPLTGERKGACIIHRGGAKEVYIDPDYWELIKYNRDSRLAMLLHEVGHCSYNKPHDDTKYEDYVDGSYPNSIMATRNAMNPYIFAELKEHFFKEFHGLP